MRRSSIALIFLLALLALGGQSAAATGSASSINGRLFLDLNNSGVWDGNDVPLSNVDVSASGQFHQTFLYDRTNEQGLYSLSGLQSDSYLVNSGYGTPCFDYFNVLWPGEYVVGYCPIHSLPKDVIIDVADGESKTHEVPIPSFEGSLYGRLWLNAGPAADLTPVSLFVGEKQCGTGTTRLVRQGAALASVFDIAVEANPTDPDCQGDTISLRLPGVSWSLYSISWKDFWVAALFDWLYEGGQESHDLSDGPILRAFGSVGSFDYQGGQTLTAIVGNTACGLATTVHSPYGPQPVHFAIIVASEQIRRGCAQQGDPVSFCLDRQLMSASNPAGWGDSFELDNLSPFDPTTPCPRLTYPDTNCDRKVTMEDVLTSLKELALQPPIHCPPAGDVNCDGSLTTADIIATLIRYIELNAHLPFDCNPFDGLLPDPSASPTPFPPFTPVPVTPNPTAS